MRHPKESIINKGQDIFRKKGYHGTGLSEILKTCGISKGTFYNYFDSKEQFAIECLENYSLQIKKLITTYMSFTSQQPIKRIRHYFEQLIKINQNEGATGGCLLMNLSTELSNRHPLLSNKVRMEFEDWVGLLAPTIEVAQRDGSLTNKISAHAIARLLYYEIFGGFVEMKAIQSTNRMQQQLDNLFRLLII